ncbi:hypothetical protein Dda_7425 [Drechslerella dactyloides]|uniref:Uncharacterized protein n=1 Tax=Drechslerella dactyloides TaxID=74499 RepID=A0AAD6ISC1_DREDA|nr:hypothetical protein Dda_7425 [Drechslerella dactyloides]
MERRYGNNSLTREAMAKVYDWIEAVLRKKYPIQSHMKEKMHVNLEEFLEILNFLWLEDCDYIISPLERLQLSLFIMISAFTLGRPGSIVLANGREDAASALCYQEYRIWTFALLHRIMKKGIALCSSE